MEGWMPSPSRTPLKAYVCQPPLRQEGPILNFLPMWSIAPPMYLTLGKKTK